MDKSIIEKTINEIILKNTDLETKCRTSLNKKDKEVIAQFEQERDTYPTNRFARTDLYNEHCDVQLEHSYSAQQKDVISYWGHTGYKKINGKIYDTEDYREDKEVYGFITDEVEKEINEKINHLQSAIDESPRVPNNTVTVRSGHWDRGHKEGDIIVQKGFASTSYTDTVDASGTDDEYSYEIKYYIPTGSKGLLLNPSQFNVMSEEELLLGKNTRQYVLNQDDDAQTVEVLILPDIEN